MVWQKWPSDGLNSAYLLEGQSDMNAMVGAVVKKGIVTGQPITEAMIARPGDRGFLAAVLTPGMRAMSIGVGNVGAVAGLIFPGDRVDILLTQRMPKFKGDSTELEDADAGKYRPRTTETLFENVRLLATNRRLNDLDHEPKDVENITIEVTPKQAEMLTVVREVGTLTLSLRGLATPTDEQAAKVAQTDPATMPATAAPAVPTSAGANPEFVNGAAAATTPTDGKAAATKSTMPEFEAPPMRGESYTFDTSVSRTLADRVMSGDEETTNVTVIHASPQGTQTEMVKAK
jgi:pilus assembly protein CpaB